MTFKDKQGTIPSYAVFSERSTICIAGPDRFDFLQGLLTQDIRHINKGLSLWAALLTPQGRILHEMFVGARDDVVLIDCIADQRDHLCSRLLRFRLRAHVEIAQAPSDWAISCLWGDVPLEKLGLTKKSSGQSCSLGREGLMMIDPRHAAIGVRLIGPREDIVAALTAIRASEASHHDYHALRISFAIPDGEQDLSFQPCFALEANMDGLNGVDFSKGCFVGQEVTARMKYRKLVKRRFIPFQVPIDSIAERPAPILKADKEVGRITSLAADKALALIRLDSLEGPLQACGVSLLPMPPEWLNPFMKPLDR